MTQILARTKQSGARFINIAYVQYYRNSSLKLSLTKIYRFMNVLLTNTLQIFHVNLQELYPSL